MVRKEFYDDQYFRPSCISVRTLVRSVLPFGMRVRTEIERGTEGDEGKGGKGTHETLSRSSDRSSPESFGATAEAVNSPFCRWETPKMASVKKKKKNPKTKQKPKKKKKKLKNKKKNKEK